ncbi:hypothetical protein A1O3_05230 [Capronia epimyces CBS 606.96]|uniref:Uncharacterized protein n=1 Tax=Capronia epimyces CBS 606.96 TaxID=1182542 RepID=W9Y5R3_9EURO|nr:uncharacterized protein A1O3_05230 [Capronia epimyces CBS 606.96]EXJ84561.1 hypothetical protein A1O3_05230 [Capronia epimyces CBS 606.96]
MERPALPDIEEPELPPTPVALGLSTAPSRPRGLASSSSPRRSLGGGGRLRRRTGAGGSVTSSPLKPRARSPRVAGDEVFTAGHDEVAGSQESEVHVQHEEDLPQGLQEKQATIQALRDQLQQLRRQNERLETLIEKDEEVMAEDLSLLREAYLVPGSLEPDFTNHEAKTLSYLTLFAPSNMRLSYRTDARQIQGRTKAIHYLTIMAPPPWLPGVFEHSFEVVTDTEAVRVEHVRLRDMMTDKPRAKSTMTGITKWIHDRMDDPLHCLDVGGMIWGVGRYFAATIERAKVFRQLHKLNTTASSMMSDPVWEGKDEELGRDQTIELSRWLDKNQLRLPDAASTESSELRAKIMLIWDIGLDWTGHITSNITIAVSGVSIKAEAKLKEVFDGLLPFRGVTGAFQSVWGLAQGNGEDQSVVAKQTGKRKRS